MTIEQKHYTLEDLHEFEDLPENRDRLFELIDGRIVEKNSDAEGIVTPSFLPSYYAGRILTKINIYLDKNPIGYISGADGGFVMPEGNKLIPDVGYISKENMPEIPEREVPVPPDLAVEVVSPTDDIKDVQYKAQRYLNAGTKIVWIVYPRHESVDVYSAAEEDKMTVQQISIDGTLDGADVLPNFTLPVRDIFHGV